MGPFYVLSNMGLFYVYQPITSWVFFMYRDPLSIMDLSYVLPRPLYIRKTHDKVTILYGSFLCTINFNERRLTPVPLPAVAEKVPCRPRLLYIRKTHNKMTVPYGSFSDCPTLRLTQVGTLNRSTTTPFLIKGVALILRHTFNQSLIIIIIIIVIKEDSCK